MRCCGLDCSEMKSRESGERCQRATITGATREDSRDAEGHPVYQRDVW